MTFYFRWDLLRSWFARHKKLLQWILALLFLALACKLLVDNKDSLIRLKEFRLRHIIALCAMYSGLLFIIAYRSLLIIRTLTDLKISFWNWYKIFIISRMGNILFSQAGNIYRAGVLKGRYRLSYTNYVNFYFFFAWVDTLLNFVLVLCLILLLRPTLTIGGIYGMELVGIVMAAILVGPILAEKILNALHPRSGVLVKVFGKLHGMVVTMLSQGSNVGLMVRIIILGLAGFAIGVLLLGITFRGMGIQPSLTDLALFLALYKLSTYIVLTPGNIGIREMAFGFLSHVLGIGMAEGIMASAILYSVHAVLVIPLGMVFGSKHLFGREKSSKTERTSSIT